MFVGDDDSVQIVRLLDQTLNYIDGVAVHEATEALGQLSTELPHFPYRLLSIDSGGIILKQALTTHGWGELELEKTLHIICKCLYFSMKSHMPCALSPLLGSFCRDMISILESLSFEWSVTPSDGYLIWSKAGKRSLLLFGTLVSRHRKYSDKLVPEIVNCSMKIVKHSSNISKLGCISERIISLAFDVISRVMEIGPVPDPGVNFQVPEKA